MYYNAVIIAIIAGIVYQNPDAFSISLLSSKLRKLVSANTEPDICQTVRQTVIPGDDVPCPVGNEMEEILYESHVKEMVELSQCGFADRVVEYMPFIERCTPSDGGIDTVKDDASELGRRVGGRIHKSILFEVILDSGDLSIHQRQWSMIVPWCLDGLLENGQIFDGQFEKLNEYVWAVDDLIYDVTDRLWDGGLFDLSTQMSLKALGAISDVKDKKEKDGVDFKSGRLLTDGKEFAHLEFLLQLTSLTGALANQLIQLNRLEDSLAVLQKSQTLYFNPLVSELKTFLDENENKRKEYIIGAVGEKVIDGLESFVPSQFLNVASIMYLKEAGVLSDSDVLVDFAREGDAVVKRLMVLDAFSDKDSFEPNKYNRIVYAFMRPHVFKYIRENYAEAKDEKVGESSCAANTDYSTKQQKNRWETVVNGKENNAGYTGGWESTKKLDALFGDIDANGFGTVDRRNASSLSREDFLENYVYQGKPVAVDGLIDEWSAIENWRRDGIVEKYGDKRIKLLLSGDGSHSGTFTGWSSLKSYVDFISDITRRYNKGKVKKVNYDWKWKTGGSEKKFGKSQKGVKRFPYFFQREFPLGEGILGDYEELSHFDTDSKMNHAWEIDYRQAKSLMILGAAGTGTGFHSHTSAYNALVYGRKRWYLLPPLLPRVIDMDTALPWYEVLTYENLNKLPVKPIVFDQYPGEVVYIPSDWYHATVNMDLSVGIAVELGDLEYRHSPCEGLRIYIEEK